ncbi:MAG: hypothetical protein HY726_16565 [Candidatus Rokubacteria bacterium]|nr:hypothetical protein [Candidatus Rokubacteria bacterium]
MKVVEAIAEILKREGVEVLSAYPTTPIIDAAAAAGIRPLICRQERVGVGIADGYTRTTNGRRIGVFAMQYGPGAENAFAGVATAYSDSVPMLLLPHQLAPFYRATAPRSYMGWGKSHALGTGLGLIIGAKLVAPEKFCVNFMGDAAFGMTGLDFETAVRCGIPITTIVLNNSAMAIERHALVVSHDRYRARDIGGNYAEIGRAMGGYAERVEKPAEIVPALERARKLNADGQPVLLEFITSEEIAFSHRRAL